MTIKYQAGRRIQGLSTDTVETATFEDDFSSDNWTDTGSQIGISGNKMVWNGLRNASFQGSYYDLGSSVSETEWELRFTLDIDTMTEGNTNAYLNIGLSDTATMNVNTSQDFIGLLLYLDTTSAGNSSFAALGVNGGTITDSTAIGTADPTALGVFYVRVRRMSATSCIIGIYSNSSYSSLIEEETVTITSGLDNLQYLKITNLSVASGAGTGVFNGTIDDVKFYNGISTVSYRPTNVQVGSRFEETDTRKIYHYTYDWFLEKTTIPYNATRGVFGGGGATNVIDYITISTLGNATDFGDLTAVKNNVAGVSNNTRGVFGGGEITGVESNIIDYITIATTGNATDFGDLTVTRRGIAGVSSSVRGVFAGGYDGSGYSNVMDYITIATTGNATDFGNLIAANNAPTGVNSDTRGVFGGGDQSATLTNVIQYITIDSTGNATDFGDLTVTRESCGGVANGTRGVFAGGSTGSNSNVMDYITIDTTGNATDFGDLTSAKKFTIGVSSATRGVFGAGNDGSYQNFIDYITIDTTGNATDFGDLTSARAGGGGVQG